MFDARTIFILGAGASWHYSQPTGEDLVNCVIEKAKIAARFFKSRLESDTNLPDRPNFVVNQVSSISPSINPAGYEDIRMQWTEAIAKASDLAERLQSVSPLVIDYFLGHNRHLEDIGKLCIAWVLLERETMQISQGININRGQREPRDIDNWYRFMIHKLVTSCPNAESLKNNHVSFLTFNYDVSLENALHKGLSSLKEFEAVADAFLNGRILHIYGQIREAPFGEVQEANWRVFDNSPHLLAQTEKYWRTGKK